jgi:serine/threonine protein kinase
VASLVRNSERSAFGKYTLIARLAMGGMGEIFLARLQGVAGFEKIVVIKRVLPHLAGEDRFVAMLLDEARIVARLSHPNICQVQELGEVEGEYYIAMEYLEGVTLADLLKRLSKQGQVLDPRLAVAVVMQACEGLHAAHELVDRSGQPTNLVHRDVSPSNLFITTAGMVKVLDFGIAKTPDRLSHTRTGAVKGKWAYMSPEQILRHPMDRRSDIFSLGIVLFEALTGWRLFHHPSEYQICRAITETDAPSVRNFQPGLPEALARAVARALARDPELRFATARDMGKALLDAIAPLGGPSSLSYVSDLVTANFTRELAQRRAFVESVEVSAEQAAADEVAASSLPVAPVMTPESPPGDDDDDSMPHVSDVPTTATADVPSPQSPAVQLMPVQHPVADLRPSRKGWLALAALLLLGAIGFFAYRVWWPVAMPPVQARVEQHGGQIVPEEPAARPGAEGNPGGEPAAAPMAGIDAGAPAAAIDAGARAPSPARDKPDRPSRPARQPQRDPYQRALAQRGAQLTQCYQEHVSEQESAPLLKLVMTIDTSGKLLEARVEPRSYGDTPLGRCVVGVVRGLSFGPHEAQAEVTIPLNIRMKKVN